MTRFVELHHSLGEPEDMVALEQAEDGSWLLEKPDYEFREIVDALIKEDTVFTRFAWTPGASRMLDRGTKEESEVWAAVIDRGLSTWSIKFEADKPWTH